VVKKFCLFFDGHKKSCQGMCEGDERGDVMEMSGRCVGDVMEMSGKCDGDVILKKVRNEGEEGIKEKRE
jgi:hypothetical protein